MTEALIRNFEYEEMLRHDKWQRSVEIACEFAEANNKKSKMVAITKFLHIATEKHDNYEHQIGRVRDTEKCWDDYPTKKREDAMNKAHEAFLKSKEELCLAYTAFENAIAELYSDPDWFIKRKYSDPKEVVEDDD